MARTSMTLPAMPAKPVTAKRVSPTIPSFYFATDVPKARASSSALAKAMATEERQNMPRVRNKKV